MLQANIVPFVQETKCRVITANDKHAIKAVEREEEAEAKAKAKEEEAAVKLKQDEHCQLDASPSTLLASCPIS